MTMRLRRDEETIKGLVNKPFELAATETIRLNSKLGLYRAAGRFNAEESSA